MKRGPITKLEKWKKTTSKKFDDDVMSKNCDVIVIFFDLWSIWSKSVKLKFSIIVKFSLTKIENRTKKYLSAAVTLLLWVEILFWEKMLIFFKESAGISKIKEVLVLKSIFPETAYVCVLTYQLSSF